MSYTPSHQSSRTVAQPNALTVIEHTTSTTQGITTGNRIEIGTVHNWYGSFSPSISTNQITLPSGYYYYIESMINAYISATYSMSSYVSYQHYNETGSANIGLPATLFAGYYEDSVTLSRDACARALIDCTSAAMTISLKVTGNTGNFDKINYSAPASDQDYAGFGRTVIWQLEDAP